MIDYVDPKDHALVSKEAPSMIRVVAPSNLPGGYEFTVEGKESGPFNVTIPDGGVQQGDVFLSPMPHGFKKEKLINAPKGRWKDGIFDCFKYGIFHDHIMWATFCTEIAMGQVMQRMRLSWLGNRINDERSLSTYRTVFTLVVCYFIFSLSLSSAIKNEFGDGNPVLVISKFGGDLLFVAWSIYALYKTRQNVREEFSIPEERCVGCEDCMCATFCGCCVVAQMARHTGDYDTYPTNFCSETGLPDHAPLAAPQAV